MNHFKPALILGGLICLGMVLAGWILGNSALKIKQYERVVSVKGLSEREVKANVAVWPIRFSTASQDLAALYDTMQSQTSQIQNFLKNEGFSPEEITIAAPVITDKYAQQYGGDGRRCAGRGAFSGRCAIAGYCFLCLFRTQVVRANRHRGLVRQA